MDRLPHERCQSHVMAHFSAREGSSCAKTAIFLSHFNLICLVQPSAQKYLSSVFQKIMFHSTHPDSIRGAARDRHGRRKQDAVDVRMLSAHFARGRKRLSRTTKARGPGPPMLGSTPGLDPGGRGLTSPVPRGERAISRKPLRRECRAASAGLRRFLCCMRGRGCVVHPVLPAPSGFSEGR